ncbi:protein translocase subunit SecF [candidate division KSB1 bacterium]
MIQIIKNTNFDFLKLKKVTFFISIAVISIGIISMIIHRGLNFGIDFVGGTLIQIQFEKNVDVGSIRNSLSAVNLGSSEIKEFGNERDVLIKTEFQQLETSVTEIIEGVFTRDFPDNPYEVRRIEQVGPKIGSELIHGALWSILFAFLLMGIYISWRFEFKFAIGAVAALVHDVLVTLAVFSLLDLEFSLPVIAAILTLVGYSLNDTIVVFDRIRENLKALRRENHNFIINKSINEVLNRTIITSLTTLFVIAIVFVFGGEVIHNFAFALLIGIITGTYSSIYIASPIVAIWKEKTEMVKRKRP